LQFLLKYGQVYYLRTDELLKPRTVTLRMGDAQRPARHLAADHFVIHYDRPCGQSFCRRNVVSEQDEFAVGKYADLMAEIQPLIPQSQYAPFDLIGVLPDMKTMRRIRVGYESVKENPEIDLYAVYSPDVQTASYVEASQFVG
jgi:hypothetical protein